MLADDGYSLRLLRFDADGSLDRTFGSDGSVAFDYSINPGTGGIVLDAVGRILVPGYVYNYSTGRYALAVARYNADGSLDTTFGSAGIAETDLGSGYAFGNGVAVDAQGRILVTGYVWNYTDYTYEMVLARSWGAGRPNLILMWRPPQSRSSHRSRLRREQTNR